MQTDPNFANYHYDPVSKRIVLFDFGATRSLSPTTVKQYRVLLQHALAGEAGGILKAAVEFGFINQYTAQKYEVSISEMIMIAVAMLNKDGKLDFSDNAIIDEMRKHITELAVDRDNWHIPQVDTLFVQRKLGGVYLLASKLKAQVDVRAMLLRYL